MRHFEEVSLCFTSGFVSCIDHQLDGADTWVGRVAVAGVWTHFDIPKSASLTGMGDLETAKLFYEFVSILRWDVTKRGVW